MYYRRSDVAGGTYFFTVNLQERRRTLLVDHIELLRSVIVRVKKGHPFTIDAMVVLPEHLHAIWTLPAGDSDYATRWRLIKGGFSGGSTRLSFAVTAGRKRENAVSGNADIGNT